ncbi:MAG: CHAT domain-containing protein [Planctomycetes bacterium]|nr:CHAT domain-containing protein [Planctomycetota bacterium]
MTPHAAPLALAWCAIAGPAFVSAKPQEHAPVEADAAAPAGDGEIAAARETAATAARAGDHLAVIATLEPIAQRLPAGHAAAALDLLLDLVVSARVSFQDRVAIEWIDAALARIGVPADEEQRRFAVYFLGERVSLELQLGRLDRALQFGRAMRDHARGSADFYARQTAAARWIELLLGRGDHDAALRASDEALADPGHAADPRYQPPLRLRRASALAGLAVRDPAQEEAALAAIGVALAFEGLGTIGRVRLLGEALDLRLKRGELAAAEELLAPLRERLAAATAAPPAERALVASAAVRLALARRAPAATLAPLQADLRRELTAALSDWSSQAIERSGNGFLQFAYRANAVGAAIEAELALDPAAGPTRALELLLDVQRVGTLARQLEATGHDLAAVRRTLQEEGATALLWFPAPAKSWLFVIDAARIEAAPCAGQAALVDAAQALAAARASHSRLTLDRSLAVGASAREAEAAAAALAHLLLTDAARDALERNVPLWISGLDAIGETSFEALPLEGVAIGTRRRVTRAPSLLVAAALAERAGAGVGVGAEPPALDCLLAAAPTLSAAARVRTPGIAPLDTLLPAVARLADAYPETRRATLAGPTATRAALRAVAPSTRVLQFLTHGVADGALELWSGLQLAGEDDADDGVLWHEQVATLPRATLVLLTACESAAGPERRGDDSAQTLAGAFLRHGARAVVVAPDRIDSASALCFSRAFHRALAQEGVAPDEATRRGREALVTELGAAPVAAAAAFVLVGCSGAPLFAAPQSTSDDARGDTPPAPGKQSRTRSHGIGGGVIVVLIVIAAARRRRRTRSGGDDAPNG